MKQISEYYFDFGGDGPLLHFLHANGFHPGVYRSLLEPLTEHYRVVAMALPPLTHPAEQAQSLHDWGVFAEHVIEQAKVHGFKPEVCMGHSLGAVVSLLISNIQPDFCNELMLLDPTFLSEDNARLIAQPAKGEGKRHPLISKTLQRPQHWPNREAAIKFHASRRAFVSWDKDVLADYGTFGFVDNPETGDVDLGYSKYWEAAVYGSVRSFWPDIEQCALPLSIVRGQFSDVIGDESWQRLNDLSKTGSLVELKETGHLLPFEKPAEVAKIVLSCLSSSRIKKNEK